MKYSKRMKILGKRKMPTYPQDKVLLEIKVSRPLLEVIFMVLRIKIIKLMKAIISQALNKRINLVNKETRV